MFGQKLLGHFNKRCREEFPQENELYKYSTKGIGLNLRAHPLGVAIANEQFNYLDQWITQKNIFAKKIQEKLKVYDFLSMPSYNEKSTPSGYAFVMNYNEKRIKGVSRDQFVEALLAVGLVEVDCPNSTRPVHTFPLFDQIHEIMPRLYKQNFKVAKSRK